MIIGIVRVRGMWGVKPKIRETLKKLNLTRVNYITLVPDNPYYIGMLKICKDYVAFGPMNKETIKRMLLKRGEITRNKKIKDDKEKVQQLDSFLDELSEGKTSMKKFGMKQIVRLKPPKHGYKSVKKAYPYGALGKWPNLDSLVERMF
ncbi:uL30 family ribosomal protein [Candidatus Micrarchaeota archaeon]|nr:uL30 family ribosomal protein [Candidatus Micrarchaeota archaeon]